MLWRRRVPFVTPVLITALLASSPSTSSALEPLHMRLHFGVGGGGFVAAATTYLAQAMVQGHVRWSYGLWSFRVSPTFRTSLAGAFFNSAMPATSYFSITLSAQVVRRIGSTFGIGFGLENGTTILRDPQTWDRTYAAVGPILTLAQVELGAQRQHSFGFTLSFLVLFEASNELRVASVTPVASWNPSLGYSYFF